MPVLVVVLGYLLGTFPTAVLVGRRSGVDPTTAGSGNPGASNVYRSAGRRAGALVLAGDLAKGALAAAAGLAAGGAVLALVAGGAAVLGHVSPATRRFRGGKGVATAAGVALVAHPALSAGLALVWLVVVRVGRTASLASLVVAVAFPAGLALVGRGAAEVALAAALSALVVLRHRSNIGRLLRRDETALAPGRSPAG